MKTPLPNNILIVGPSWVGDMVMIQTLLRLLKRRQAKVNIDVLAPLASLPLIDHMPEVRYAIPLPIGHGQLQLKARYQLGRSLRAKQYHRAIILPNSWKSALIPFWAKIKIRTGWCGEMRYGLLNDVRHLNKSKLPLMIQRFMSLGLEPKTYAVNDSSLWPALDVSVDAVQAVIKKFNFNTNRPNLALCPGAEYGPAKRWPVSYFAEVAREYLQRGWQVSLLGGPKDTEITAEIMQATANQCTDFAGQTTLNEAVMLLSQMTVVVSNDSGLMHIAAGLNKPLVVIYGSSDPKFTPPLSHQVKILSLELACSPCFKRQCPLQHLDCLRKLPVSRVIAAVEQVIMDEKSVCAV